MWAVLGSWYSVERDSGDPVTVRLEASIVTDNAADTLYENALNAGHFYNTEPDQIVQSSETYITPGGLEAVIVTNEFAFKEEEEQEPEQETEGWAVTKERETCAFFVWEDVLYELSIIEYIDELMDPPVFCLEDAAAADLLKQILDAYE